MARVTIEDCLEQVNNRFLLVHLGAKRVIQLRKGATPLYDAPKNKEIVLALREIAAGEVDFESIEKIEQDELTAGSLASPQLPEEDSPAQEVQEEKPAAKVEDSSNNETKQENAVPDEAD